MIVLVGFMGAGKTTVGQLLADRLSVRFVDADQVIQAETGRSIAEIFAADGEAGFRAIEAAVVTRLLTEDHLVLALGGGALGSAEVRAALEGHQVVLLDVPLATAQSRIGRDASRPMLTGNDLDDLYRGRQQAYRDAAQCVVSVAGRSPSEVAAAVQAAIS